jgi:tetratricopeptide (TPR) repeat protein
MAASSKRKSFMFSRARSRFESLFRRRASFCSMAAFLCGILLMLPGVLLLSRRSRADMVAHYESVADASQQPTIAFEPVGQDDDEALKKIEKQIILGNFHGAIPSLHQYLKAYSDSARAHYDLGYALFRTHQIGDSIKQLSKSLELNSRNAQAHKILGLDCSLVGRYDLAEIELQQAAHLEPDSAEIHYLLGRVYYTRGVYPLAEREFRAAVRLSPSYMKAYANLGLTMEILGNNDEAVKDYLTAARLNEQQKLRSPWPYEYLSAFYNRQQKPQQAIQYAQQAISMNAKFDLAYFQIAKAYEYLARWLDCETAARKAISLNSRIPDYYYVLSLALRKEGKSKASEAALATFAELHQKQLTESELWQKARENAVRTGSSPARQP